MFSVGKQVLSPTSLRCCVNISHKINTSFTLALVTWWSHAYLVNCLMKGKEESEQNPTYKAYQYHTLLQKGYNLKRRKDWGREEEEEDGPGGFLHHPVDELRWGEDYFMCLKVKGRDNRSFTGVTQLALFHKQCLVWFDHLTCVAHVPPTPEK